MNKEYFKIVKRFYYLDMKKEMPDMLVLGRLGWGEVRENRFTVDEQMTHMTLWALLAG
jgi:hypothetical protein